MHKSFINSRSEMYGQVYRQWWSLVVSLLMVQAAWSLETQAEGNDTLSEEDDVLFRLAPPLSLITVLYDNPPSLHTVQLYIHKNVTNFTILAESTKLDVATISEIVNITKCTNQTGTAPKTEKPKRRSKGTTLSSPQTAEVKVQSVNEECVAVSFYATSVFLGYSTLALSAQYQTVNGSEVDEYVDGVTIVSIRPFSFSNMVFKYVLQVMLASATFAMGCEINLQTVKEHLKTPKAPAVALASQYVFMPLLAFSVVILRGYKGGWALGYFLMGCVPGGGGSNMFAKLLNGDMSLSITLTSLSLLASIGMLPFWVYTLGMALPVEEEVGRLKIPFLNIVTNMLILIVPILIGTLVKYKLPRAAKAIRRPLKGYFSVLIILVIGVSIYENLYIFQLNLLGVIATAAILPYGGYIFGACISWVFRFEWTIIKTVSIETGMQNYGLAMLILTTAVGQPDADIARISVVGALLFTALPLNIISPIYVIRERIQQKRKDAAASSNGSDKDSEGHKLDNMLPANGDTGSDDTDKLEKEKLCAQTKEV